MSVPISLVIGVYNRQAFLAAAIESVLAQTYTNFELLIWDDGSTDDSLSIAHSYANQDDRLRVVSMANQGVASALKAAIAETTGEYLGWVDSDDLIAPTALAETAMVLDADPEVGMVYTDYSVMDERGRVGELGSRCHTPYSQERLLTSFMTFQFRLMRREVYDQVGGIDAGFERAEDYDLCLKLSEVTRIHHVPRSLYCYRQHAGNMTKNQLEQIRWAYIASTAALVRRGLDQEYELEMQVRCQFSLQRKPLLGSG